MPYSYNRTLHQSEWAYMEESRMQIETSTIWITLCCLKGIVSEANIENVVENTNYYVDS